MFGINGSEFIILAVLAVLILGPDKLPGYAQQLAELVKSVRRMAQGAKDQLREEVGEEITEIEWRKLDPRQYDPRRIIKEALLDDFEDAARAARETPKAPSTRKAIPASTPAVEPGAAANGTATASSATTSPGAGIAAAGVAGTAAALPRLADGEPAPFDLEAT